MNIALHYTFLNKSLLKCCYKAVYTPSIITTQRIVTNKHNVTHVKFNCFAVSILSNINGEIKARLTNLFSGHLLTSTEIGNL